MRIVTNDRSTAVAVVGSLAVVAVLVWQGWLLEAIMAVLATWFISAVLYGLWHAVMLWWRRQ